MHPNTISIGRLAIAGEKKKKKREREKRERLRYMIADDPCFWGHVLVISLPTVPDRSLGTKLPVDHYPHRAFQLRLWATPFHSCERAVCGRSDFPLLGIVFPFPLVFSPRLNRSGGSILSASNCSRHLHAMACGKCADWMGPCEHHRS